MDRRSWLWRRKSSEKSPGETESSVGSMSSHSERFSDDQVFSNRNSHSLEVNLEDDLRQNEHNHGVMNLPEASESNCAKEELVKQHIKVAEEAVTGWEKAEREVLALRQQVEVLTLKNSTLEDRVLHLDGALKECLRQLRQTREEKDQIALEALEKKISETESSLTSTDTEIHHKLEMIEKENMDLKFELSSMAEELEIRLVEMELSNQYAEQASKQLLDSVKRIAKLEADCHMLNSALQKANNNRSKSHRMLSLANNDGITDTSKFERNGMELLAQIDLMEDFLEMERLVALPESSEAEEMLKKIEVLEKTLKERENELKVLRNRLKESEATIGECKNELNASRNQLIEAQSKLTECKNELKKSNDRLEEAESKWDECENELKVSRKWLEESESMLAEQETELKTSGKRLKEAESKLVERENELKASRNMLAESEVKLGERENELKVSRYLFKEAECKLAKCENELKTSKSRLDEAKTDHENKLSASRNQLKEAESKLHKTECRLEMTEAGLKATKMKNEEAESQCKALESELETLFQKVEYLENNVIKEKNLSRKVEDKCRELEDEVSRLQHKVQGTKSANRAEELRSLKAKQDTELAIAGSKFAECQKTIASINQQLKTLTMFDDLLIDTNDS